MFGGNPFINKGEKWKEIRAEISPALNKVCFDCKFELLQADRRSPTMVNERYLY